MNKELEEEIKRALITKHRGTALISVETLDTVLNYIDNSISKEVIKEKIKYKKSKLKQIENDRYREMCLQIEIDILEKLLEEK